MNIKALVCILLLIVVEYILVFIRMYKIRKNNIELCEKRKDTCKLKVTGEVVDKIETEGLKCKVIKKNELDRVYVYFFMYETECEEMNKLIEVLERRNSLRLVK